MKGPTMNNILKEDEDQVHFTGHSGPLRPEPGGWRRAQQRGQGSGSKAPLGLLPGPHQRGPLLRPQKRPSPASTWLRWASAHSSSPQRPQRPGSGLSEGAK